ncbi:MAG: helix-turn-helix domain-containing protein [Nitrospirae bacterium]|nr:helix-turn-helix domain-containing protein [Nitrospirota bacterium]MBF0463076.1 helix-turn-helix domain-containing protein [Magnetococcales bacterium]MBF0477012.1 helix-turn-helix domain-containing protein [Deltaproteobacteria bacterium]
MTSDKQNVKRFPGGLQVSKQVPLIDCDPNFVHIFRYLFRNEEAKKMGPYAFMVYVCIKTYSNIRTGSAWPGIDKIVNETGISRKKVITSIQLLCEMGYIKKEEKAGKVNKYQIVEKIPFAVEGAGDEGKGEITFDYTPTLLQTAMTEIKNFAMSGDAKDAKVIHIEKLTINIVNQRDHGQVNYVTAEEDFVKKMLERPEDDPIRKHWEARERAKKGNPA